MLIIWVDADRMNLELSLYLSKIMTNYYTWAVTVFYSRPFVVLLFYDSTNC